MENLIENKLLKADEAFQEWKKVPFEEKQKLIAKAAEIFKNKSEVFGELITNEMNKPISQAISEVEKCALMMNYYADAQNILRPEKIESEYEISEIHYVPKGVILGVMPWNFPFWQVLRFATPAILAGNTVVLKHASICFGSGNAIEKVFVEAGFPEGVFQNLEVGHGDVKEILEYKTIKGVSLTGSEKAGAEVAATAGKNIKKSLLELGGSDAFIVLDDADLDEAAKVGALARLQNCGQTCVAAKRFIIQREVEFDFLPKFIEEYKKYVPADPILKETKLGGMARPDLADDLEKQYQKALDHGAEAIIPLERISENEFIPGLIRVEEGNPILQEELFGPLGMVLIAHNDEEALEIANNIPFGLSNSVWTKNEERQQFFIDGLESGTVNINRMTSSDPRFPFGGTKSSGYGTELSLLALKEFVTAKTILGK
ncbi:aldehyde dehydrogenase family protein [Chryseobacterium indoltheticum]|uniref:Succinate semialdehyde dehydrogenase [NAD(P)+] Sad n=1 Tax=Chryseobacterium indoltheticum TaxID=254 RepID=A0A381JQQ6_9FLAO|nr:aldehyde dehydrogenase family protein [Chryseobacterium indoltheticum]AZA75653.1 aldehyde dehydrogenase family protein [Chryseobacterium indoltheticum]SIQ46306.1 succinate-semialdehyde dehydrogenase / glutarate-semialdehyde dehydrogenase [Chryseobacterium indoltheticum]SUY53783.1 Succinate semialdehyde dehydrogenase [NAD(P)+] Sad [Chryseobacterium indoltheticum]